MMKMFGAAAVLFLAAIWTSGCDMGGRDKGEVDAAADGGDEDTQSTFDSDTAADAGDISDASTVPDASAEDAGPHPILADYAAALRESEPREDGQTHIDSPALADKVVALGADTYAFLIIGETDWSDLNEYLPIAEAAGLTTWVYLVPPSELPEDLPPYQDDYVAWADAIGQLAAEFPGLEAFAIDDWFRNMHIYTPAYTCEMVAAGRAHRPDLKFYAVDYFPWAILDTGSSEYKGCVDGIIFPYIDLDSNAGLLPQIERIATIREPSDWMQIAFPASTASTAGTYGRFVADCNVVSDEVSLQFELLHHYGFGGTLGYHRARVSVDDTVVWYADIGTPVSTQPHDIALPASSVEPGSTVQLALELYEQQGVSDYSVTASFRNLEVAGCEPIADSDWTYEESATAFDGRIFDVEGFEDLDLIVMIYAAPTSWHSAPPATEIIVEGLEIGLDAYEAGIAQGVITYCLDKTEESDDFDSVSELYHLY